MLGFWRRHRTGAAALEADFAQEDEGAPARSFALAPGTRAYAIGDIHGRLDLFVDLMEMILEDCAARPEPTRLEIVLLGDVIDRGPDSRALVDMILRLRTELPRVHCLMGNHEEVFGLVLRGEMGALPLFLRIGGRETLLSYGLDEALLDGDDTAVLHEAMLQCVPEAHRDFIYSLPHSVRIDDYLFVHAGIRPHVPLDDQVQADLHWIREDFLDSDADHGVMVIHGHSITDDVDVHPNRVGIDTGAYFSERLTAIGLEGAERWFLHTDAD